MIDFHTYVAHVVPLRPDYGPFIVRGAGFALQYDDPVPARIPNATWSIDGDAATLAGGDVPSDRAIYAEPAAGGEALLRAFVGPPVDRELDVPVFAYRSFALRCPRTAESTEPLPFGNDLAVRGIACGTPARRTLGIVARAGFTFVAARTLAEFAAVPAHAWHAGGPKAAGFATFGTLLARLGDGRTLKFFMTAGNRNAVEAPFVVAPAGGEFADVSFLASGVTPSFRRLPDRIRIPSATPCPQATDDTIADGAFRNETGSTFGEIQYARDPRRARGRPNDRGDDRADLSDLDVHAIGRGRS